jgi:hypothetical protein
MTEPTHTELKMALRAIEAQLKAMEDDTQTPIPAGAHAVNLRLQIDGVYTKLAGTLVTPKFNEEAFLRERITAWALSQPDATAAVQRFLTAAPLKGRSKKEVDKVDRCMTSCLDQQKAEFKQNAPKYDRAGATSFAGVVRSRADE